MRDNRPRFRWRDESFSCRYFHEHLAQNGCLTVKFNYPRMVALCGLLKAPAPSQVLVETYRRLIQEVKKGKYQPAKVFAGGLLARSHHRLTSRRKQPRP